MKEHAGKKIIFPLGPILFILALVATGCLQRPPTKQRSRILTPTPTVDVDNSTPDPNAGTPIADSIYWYTQKRIDGIITINENAKTVIYLRGEPIDRYLTAADTSGLNNFSKSHCIVFDFDLGLVSNIKQYRTRAIPIIFTNFQTGKKERLFRVDLTSVDENGQTCNGTVDNISSSSQIAYTTPDICPLCRNFITSDKVTLYTSQNGIADSFAISKSVIDFSILGLRVDVFSESQEGNSVCTNSSCQAQGYSCCLNGQCVTDGVERPDATSVNNYNQAISDVQLSPANFVFYPEIFYVCPGNAIPRPTPSPTPDYVATADAELEILKGYYFCQKGVENQTPSDYSNCSPTNDIAAYTDIKNKIWDICECDTLGNTPPEDPVNTCPAYELEARDEYKELLSDITIDDTNLVKSINCFTPPIAIPTPFQSLSIPLSGRRVPHRFFMREGGTPVPEIETLAGTPEPNGTPLSEGPEFYYLDDATKSLPIEDETNPFSMNLILGQLRTDLTAALPALRIEIELNKSYIISTDEGTYTPCPQCSPDGWFSAFSAFPRSDLGAGLRPIGGTSQRDTWSTNLSRGNYEDTIFGRACWVPPTMLPLSHSPMSLFPDEDQTIQNQRLRRLETQSAYFVNGYQRDWYGFNFGALIGSFDGVSWFAIGKGRRIEATSRQLFLAINAPYGDLAENSTLTVSVVEDDRISTVPQYDWNPDSSIDKNSPLQNEAASCQAEHICENDTECITHLGWEYTCATINNYRTLWPGFSSDADEILNSGASLKGPGQFIPGGLPPTTDGRKRCVYRGMGAPCVQNYTAVSSTYRKFFTCAPNFYCASLTDSNLNKFINREPTLVSNFIYGQGSPRLGRPKFYTQAENGGLTSIVQANMQENAKALGLDPSTIGMCRPGKDLKLFGEAGQPAENHRRRDAQERTDYISQIGSCDADRISGDDVALNRLHACPLIDDEGNYYYTDSIDETVTDYADIDDPEIEGSNLGKDRIVRKLIAQNACGAESLSSSNISPFAFVEAEPLKEIFALTDETIVRHACYRRAGAVCHTDLDCSPNKLHAQEAFLFGESFFGENEAEKKYWEESLVCGQRDYVPPFNSTDSIDEELFLTYNVSKNRCCRRQGQILTMYTENDPETITENPTLRTDPDSFSVHDPMAVGRYSRYSVLEDLQVDEPTLEGSNTEITPVPVQAAVVLDSNGEISELPKKYQWMTFHKTGEKTCCGGGWIRKFADGTNNWITFGTRLKLDYTNFACLNFRSNLYFFDQQGKTPNMLANDSTYNLESGSYCVDQTNNGCIQYDIPEAEDFDSDPIPPKSVNLTEPKADQEGEQPLVDPGTGGSHLMCTKKLASPSGNDKYRIHDIYDGDPDPEIMGTDDNVYECFVRVRSYQRFSADPDTPEIKWLHDLAPYPPILADDSDYTYDDPDLAEDIGPVFNKTRRMVLQLPSYINGAANIRNIYLSGFNLNDSVWQDVDKEYANNQVLGNLMNDNIDGRPQQENNNNYAYKIPALFPDGGGTKSNSLRFDRETWDPYCDYGSYPPPLIEFWEDDIVDSAREGWCVEPTTGRLHIAISKCRPLGANNCDDIDAYDVLNFESDGTIWDLNVYAIIIEFNPMGALGHCPYPMTDAATKDEVTLNDKDDAVLAHQTCEQLRENKDLPYNTSVDTEGNNLAPAAVTPGNELYYLNILERFELSGIPQIYYEPLYCTSDRNKLIEGLFDLEDSTFPSMSREAFEDASNFTDPELFGTVTYDSSEGPQGDITNPGKFVVGSDKLIVEPVFSSHEFQCCFQLGNLVDDPTQCCSGYGKPPTSNDSGDTSSTSKFECLVPNNVDLYVYFNKFVSGEGVSEDVPEEMRLIMDDFDPITGYPKTSTDVFEKIKNLGEKYCDNHVVVTGGAFGRYDPKRFGNTLDSGGDDPFPYGITFQLLDSQPSNPDQPENSVDGPKGGFVFYNGFRWNHHLYCTI